MTEEQDPAEAAVVDPFSEDSEQQLICGLDCSQEPSNLDTTTDNSDTDYDYDTDNYVSPDEDYVNPDISHGAVSPLDRPLYDRSVDVKTQHAECIGGAKARTTQDEKICQLGQGLANRQAYINAKVHIENTGKHFTERVFVDPGNLLHNGLAISYDFFKRSGLRLVERQDTYCHTAKKAKSGALFQLGYSSPLSLKLPGISKILLVERPVILKNLCDSLNLGMGCLQKLEADMSFRKTGTRLICRKDEVNLIAGLRGTVDAPCDTGIAVGSCVTEHSTNSNGLEPNPTANKEPVDCVDSEIPAATNPISSPNASISHGDSIKNSTKVPLKLMHKEKLNAKIYLEI